MTLAALLEELSTIDPEEWEEIMDRFGGLKMGLHGHSITPQSDLAQALIQNSIQRACEKREWEIDQNYRTRGRDGNLPKNMRHYAVITSWDKDVHTYRGMGNSATKALLAAYIAAVKGEKKTISKDEIKCVARRFAWRSCNSHMKTKHDWEAGFNMGFKAANQTRAIKNRQELYGLLRERYASATTQSKPDIEYDIGEERGGRS